MKFLQHYVIPPSRNQSTSQSLSCYSGQSNHSINQPISKNLYNASHRPSMHQLLTDQVDISYNLRSRAHSRALPEKKGHLADKNFIVRMLYKYSY